jgi:hypothetical protein
MFFIEPKGLVCGTQKFRDNPDGIEGHALLFFLGDFLCKFSSGHIQVIDISNYNLFTNRKIKHAAFSGYEEGQFIDF